MRKMGWGLGLAAALALVAGQVRAQNAPQGGRAGSTTDNSAGSMGTGAGSMGTGSGSGSMSGSGSATEQQSTSGHFDALTGKVQRFDRSNNELTLTGSDRKLKVDSSTKVMRDGARASIDDIKEGEQVRASYSGSGDTLRVQSIDITSAGAMGTGTSGSSSKKSSPHGGANAPSGNSGDTSSGSSGTKSY